MKAVFADTWFYVALLDSRDANNDRVVAYSDKHRPGLVTTRWILAEVANFFSKSSARISVARFIRREETEKNTRVFKSDALFDRGLVLYEKRPDKEWSLTDCISFVVMEREGLREALTNDRHFKQAGFVPVFADHA